MNTMNQHMQTLNKTPLFEIHYQSNTDFTLSIQSIGSLYDLLLSKVHRIELSLCLQQNQNLCWTEGAEALVIFTWQKICTTNVTAKRKMIGGQ